jgi:hypothetical protein
MATTGSTINTPTQYYDFGGSTEILLRQDDASAGLTYYGYSLFLTADDTASIWKIKKVQKTGNVTTTTFADGDMLYDNSWTNRGSLTYK